MLYDGVGLCTNSLVGPQDMQRLGPEPFRGVDTSFVSGVVNFPLLTQLVDFGCLLNSGMTFPQDKHRIRILSELGQQSQRCSLFICEHGSTTRCIESDTHYLLCRTFRTF